MHQQLGISSGVAAYAGFEPLIGLNLAISHQFSWFQVFLSDSMAAEEHAVQRFHELAKKHRINLLVHAASQLGAISPATLARLSVIVPKLSAPGQPLLVCHYNGDLSVAEALAALHQLTAAGLHPALENYSRAGRGPEDSSGYGKLIQKALITGLPITVVLDLPRFFNRRDFPAAQGIACLKKLLLTLTDLNPELILHLIDTDSEQQGDRSQWRPIGQGRLPLHECWLLLLANGWQLKAVILEYERIDLCLQSRATVAQWFEELPR